MIVRNGRSPRSPRNSTNRDERTRQCRVSALGTWCEGPKHMTAEDGGEVREPKWKMTLKKSDCRGACMMGEDLNLLRVDQCFPCFCSRLPLGEEDNKVCLLGGGRGVSVAHKGRLGQGN